MPESEFINALDKTTKKKVRVPKHFVELFDHIEAHEPRSSVASKASKAETKKEGE